MAVSCKCLFPDCNVETDVSLSSQPLEIHLMQKHKLVIADIENLSLVYLPNYTSYWRERFAASCPEDFCHVIRTNPIKNDPVQDTTDYYLLSDVIPEDQQIRKRLYNDKLEEIIVISKSEQADTKTLFTCLFCDSFKSNRLGIFHHLQNQHSMCLGHYDNIVFTVDLFTELKRIIASNICLFCEKTFKDRFTLKEHMRKRNHRRIKITNPKYDKHFVMNYVEGGFSWKSTKEGREKHFNLSYVNLHPEPTSVISESCSCAFCSHSAADVQSLWRHMTLTHRFDFVQLVTDFGLDFQARLALITYIRCQTKSLTCYLCLEVFTSSEDLESHVNSDRWCRHGQELPPSDVYCKQEFYQVQHDSDVLLCDSCSNENEEIDRHVIQQDVEDVRRIKELSILNFFSQE